MSDSLKLGITKVGDLLLKNFVTQNTENKQIIDINLEIPDYQRPYKWTAKNVMQLFDDILNAKNENKEVYRVGTLILYKKSHNSYEIVDGQQRIISFSLFLKALNNDLNIKFLEQSLADNPFNKHNIPNNYRAIERRISNTKDKKEIKELSEYILNQCELIVVITEDLSEAFQFFDSQNARGRKLYPHDLLKAYHLREMRELDAIETERVVKKWEDLDQPYLSALFSNYLYRIKEWTKGNKAWELDEHNIHVFKGITRQDNYPYAQFFKGAYAYSNTANNSAMPFVSGIRNLRSFQLDTPIIAGKPFFDYAQHYFGILKDVQDNDKYEGYYIQDNDIVKTLELPKYKNGVGNKITRLLFDTAILFYVDRFCPEKPTKADTEMLDQFVIFAFIWAYSLRAQYNNLGWSSVQNYVIGSSDVINTFNIYKIIKEADSPVSLFSTLSNNLHPLPTQNIVAKKDNIDDQKDQVYQNYLYYFKIHKFMENENEN